MFIKELYVYYNFAALSAGHNNETTVIEYGIFDEDIEYYKETHTIYKNGLWLNDSYKNDYEKDITDITDIENVNYITLIKTLI